MLKLVDYYYFQGDFQGKSIPSKSFEKLLNKATSRVHYYTSNRINENNLDDNIRNTVCEIIELLFEQENLKLSILDEKEIASESLGPRTVSYVNKTNLKNEKILTEKELENQIYKICYQNLVHTGLMYRGIK